MSVEKVGRNGMSLRFAGVALVGMVMGFGAGAASALRSMS